MSTSPRGGLVWDDSGWDLEPKWASEPSLEAIQATCRRVLQLDPSDDCSVSLMGQGALNKAYLVEGTLGRKWVFRASLPVDPHNKTDGEVATLCWLERHTCIPTPRVTAFDASSENELGYEWILMDLMPGTSLHHRWRKMSLEAKTALVEKMAEHQAQLFNSPRFLNIGTLKDISLDVNSKSVPGHLVCSMFFMGSYYDCDVPRGPFRSSHDWLKSLISIIIQDQKRLIIEDSGSDSDSNSHGSPGESSDSDEDSDEEESKVAEYNVEVAEMLLDLLPDIFPKIRGKPEPTVLLHDDLSMNNILVDDDGAITAIIDWECVSAVPLWLTTRMPQFLRGRDREDEPSRDDYMDADLEMEAESRTHLGVHYLDSEGKDPLYWDHMMEYEQTLLRKVYSDRLSQLCPAWCEALNESELKRDFYEAVLRCANRWRLGRIDDWVQAIKDGEFQTMAKMMQPVGVNVCRE